MKSLNLLVFFLVLISLFNIAKLTCSIDLEFDENGNFKEDNPTSADSCIHREFSQDEIKQGAYRCCYLEVEAEIGDRTYTERTCVTLTQREYDDIDDAVDVLDDVDDFEVNELDCKSNYIVSTLLLLLFIFL